MNASPTPTELLALKTANAALLNSPDSFCDLVATVVFALGSAQLLQSPESAAELVALTARVSELEAERHSTNEALSDAAEQLRVQRDRIAELEAAAEKVAGFCAQRAEYVDNLRNCHPDNGHDYDRWQGHAAARRQLSQLLGLPVGWPIEDAKQAEDVSPQVEKLRGLLAGQRSALEDPHESPLHTNYLVPHDLPEIPGQQNRRAV